MELVLSSHPEVSITPECRFIAQYFSHKFPAQIALDKEQESLLVDLMRNDDKLNNWPDLDAASWIDRQAPFAGRTIGTILSTLFKDFAHAASQGTRILGNKKGLYAAGYGPYTREVFPHAKFIFMIRDPRDVVRSNKVDLKRELELVCRDILKRYGHIRSMADQFPDAVRIQRFEDLLREPEQTLHDICAFLRIPYSDRMIHFYENNAQGGRLLGNRTRIHTNTTRPFDPSKIGQWKNAGFTAEEVNLIETTTAPILRENGY